MVEIYRSFLNGGGVMSKRNRVSVVVLIILLFISVVFAQNTFVPPDMEKDWKPLQSVGISPSTQCGTHLNVLIRQAYIEPGTSRLGIQLIPYSYFRETIPILTVWETDSGTLRTALWLGSGNWQFGEGGYTIEHLCGRSSYKEIKEDVFLGVKITIFVNKKPFIRTYYSSLK